MPQHGKDETRSPTMTRSLDPTTLFLAGPTQVPRDTLEAMLRPVVAHRSAEFLEAFHRVSRQLSDIFLTARPVHIATGSATLMMESALRSTTPPGGRILHVVCGAFSERWQKISAANGLESARLDFDWGRAVDPEALREALAAGGFDAVTLVHNETSTGVLNPLPELVRVVREESNALVLVDAVSSLGGAELRFDDWGLDVALTGSQKALALPPGLSFFAWSERAEARARRNPQRGFYTDLVRYADAHPRGTITTPAVSIVWAAHQQLPHVLAEGLEARWTRHRALRDRTVDWARARGIGLAADELHLSPTLTCLRHPDPAALVSRVAEHGLTLARGYGHLKDTTFRIGHMGETRLPDLEHLLSILDSRLER